MAATAPAQTKLLTLNDLDFFLRLASEILANPDKKQIEGVERNALLLRVQNFADLLAKGGLFNLDASVIYADDSSQFLTELTITLKSLRPKLLGEAKPIEFRTREEIVSAYQEEKRKEKTQHRGPPGTTRQDIERMTKKWLISQKEAALIAEHLKTTSRLTDRTLSQVETAKSAIARAIAQNPQIMEQLSPLLPKENRAEAIIFLTEHLADGVSAQLPSVYYESDISSVIKNGVVSTLKDSSQGRKAAANLSTNATILDSLTDTIVKNHAREVLGAARGTRMVQKVFAKTGGEERLSSFIEMSQDQLAEELQNELSLAINLSPGEKDRTKSMERLVADFTKSIDKDIAAGRRPENLAASFAKFLAEHPSLSQLASLNQADIGSIARRLEARSQETVRLLTSAKRLQNLSYPKQATPPSGLLFQRVKSAQLPSTLLSLPKSLGGFFRLPPSLAAGSTLNLLSRFNNQVPEGLLLSLLGYDRGMLSQFKSLYTRLLSQGTVEEARGARDSLLLIRKAEEFMRIHPRRYALFRNYWKMTNLGDLVGPFSSQNPNYRSFLQRIIIDLSGRRANSIGWQRFFGFARSYGSSFSSSSFSSLSQFLTNIIRPRFFGSNIIFQNGMFKSAPLFFHKIKDFFGKRIFGGLGRLLGGMLAKTGLGALLGSVFPGIGTAIGTIVATVAPFILKHWKKVAAGALGAGYMLLQLLFGNLAQIASFIVTSVPAAMLGFFLGGPPGALAAIGINAFVHAQFGGWGGFLSAAGGWINGFLSGLSAAGSAVGGALGGIFAGGVLAASAILVPIAVLIGTLAIILTTAGTLFQPQQATIGQCVFTRSNVGKPIKSTILQNWISQAANAASIPPAILASVAMHESPDFVANANDDHDAIKSGRYEKTGPVFCEKAGDVLHSNPEGKDDPCTQEEKAEGARDAKAIGFMQILDIYNPDKDLYSITESLALAAEKLKARGGLTPQPTKDLVDAAVKGYHNSCFYPPLTNQYNYCDEVWRDYQNCQTGSLTGVVSSCPVPDGKIKVGSLDGVKDTGHCSTSYGTCAKGVNSRRAKSIDVDTQGKDVVFPTVNNEIVQWYFVPDFIFQLNQKGDCESSVDNNCGKGYIFQAQTKDGTKWTLNLLHLDEKIRAFDPVGPNNSGVPVGKTVSNIFLHINIGRNIKKYNSPPLGAEDDDPGWVKPEELGMCVQPATTATPAL